MSGLQMFVDCWPGNPEAFGEVFAPDLPRRLVVATVKRRIEDFTLSVSQEFLDRSRVRELLGPDLALGDEIDLLVPRCQGVEQWSLGNVLGDAES